jgi:hypothetical protein
MHLELSGEIYRGAGALLSGGIPEFAGYLASYLDLVKNAGREVVRHGRVSEPLSESLETPMVTLPGFNQLFLAKVNQLIDAHITPKTS